MVDNWQAYRNHWDSHTKHVGAVMAVSGMDQPMYTNYYHHILPWLFPRTIPVKLIYDIGCGAGRILPALKTFYPDARYVGLDISKELLDFCKTTYPEREWILIDDVYLPEEKADFIMMHSVLTHIYEDDARRWLKCVHDHLAPEGTASLSIHIMNDKNKTLTGNIIRIDYNPSYFQSMLEEAGFQVFDVVDSIQRYYGVRLQKEGEK